MIPIVADLHTHTLASQHAYSSLYENIVIAARKGFCALANTDHGPAIPDSPHIWNISKQKKLPTMVEGVRVLRGVEANIIDYKGKLDVDHSILEELDWVIASMHPYTLPPATVQAHTNAWLAIAQNPYVDMIGHCGDTRFAFEIEPVIKAFKQHRKIVEVNNNTFYSRPESRDNWVSILRCCMEYEVPVAVSSDAHFCTDVGNHSLALAVLEELKFPSKLVINSTVEQLDHYLHQYRQKPFRIQSP